MLLKILLFAMSLHVGTATTFWANGDPSNPNPDNACYLRAKGIPKHLDDNSLSFAHKTIGCGKTAVVCNLRTNKCARGRRTDWGPRHNEIDLTKKLARAIRSNGMDTVLIVED